MGAKEKIHRHCCATVVAAKGGEPPMLKERAVKEHSARGCACPAEGVEAAVSVSGVRIDIIGLVTSATRARIRLLLPMRVATASSLIVQPSSLLSTPSPTIPRSSNPPLLAAPFSIASFSATMATTPRLTATYEIHSERCSSALPRRHAVHGIGSRRPTFGIVAISGVVAASIEEGI
ncbi:hypothetical protein GUJ93_ZPchr0002g24004 [Zizania palustris]|uniref:Uncharacterized protein n=1 Tax=Zizania palustris TaxID=103762 RepID=A0A8J5VE46_ZIZPA|nr:hypothetical protein GUJ93_ZPchr0002g24004 [Zizania palustris]